MPTPSPAIVHVLARFASSFARPTFDHAVVLITGSLLARGRRTVTSTLRADGLIETRHYLRDVVFGEDRSRVRSGAAPRLLAALRNAILTLLSRPTARQSPQPAAPSPVIPAAPSRLSAGPSPPTYDLHALTRRAFPLDNTRHAL